MSLWYLPAGVPFADAVARALLTKSKENEQPLNLPDTLLLVPTRRAVRTFREAFLRASAGVPLLLPRLQALGDLDADEMALSGAADFSPQALALPPAIEPLRRKLLLARLVSKLHPEWSLAQSLDMSDALARLMDDMVLEAVSPDKCDTLVDDLSEHWGITLSFLKMVFAAWPQILADEGVLDPSERLVKLLEAQTALWTRQPPQHPVIIAGSLGTIPAIRNFMKLVQTLPQGEVILPALCPANEAFAWWDHIDSPHPFKSLTSLVSYPDEAKPWPHTPSQELKSRRVLWHTALLPASATDQWSNLPSQIVTDCQKGVSGLVISELPTEQEEAQTIAAIMRAALEKPERTALLVTPSRELGRRVASELERWGVQISDSAGTPLAKTAPALFLRHILNLALQFSPSALLALLKHPLAACGVPPSECRKRARFIEKNFLRGLSKSALSSFDALTELLSAEEDLSHWARHIESLFAPLISLLSAPSTHLSDLIKTLVVCAESLASGSSSPSEPEPTSTPYKDGASRVWRKEEGRALSEWIMGLLTAAQDFPAVNSSQAVDAIDELMTGIQVRQPYGQHPRLAILGPLEAQLQHADWVILGGLNEGTWPAPPKPDPWMSRPMRARLGLKPPEERIGQQAHDFYSLATAPRVFMTRATRQAGTPTVPSRWLQRLNNLLSSLAISAPYDEGLKWAHIARMLDHASTQTPAQEPRPTPPAAVRPRRLSVTEIETLQKDPYSIYARHILRLMPLKELEPEKGAADRGTLYHAIVKRFVEQTQESWPDNPHEVLMSLADDEMKLQKLEGQKSIWKPHLEKMAEEFLKAEKEHRDQGARFLAAETRGYLDLHLNNLPPFRLTAKADRIDQTASGDLIVIDYKTGTSITKKSRENGQSLQLPLEGLMAQKGHFEQVPEGKNVSDLQFWWLKPRKKDDTAKTKEPFSANIQESVSAAEERLENLISTFAQDETPYLCEPDPSQPNRFSDYRHLARHAEWNQQTDDDSDDDSQFTSEENAS